MKTANKRNRFHNICWQWGWLTDKNEMTKKEQQQQQLNDQKPKTLSKQFHLKTD